LAGGGGDVAVIADCNGQQRARALKWKSMIVLFALLGVSLCLGGVGLLAFMWSLRTGQYEDLEGSANRILFEEE
jgi:cbb3-type cytochrome oxidase maturation protein